MIETAVVAIAMITLFSGLLGFAYTAFAKVWLQYSSYEAVMCLATTARVNTCRSALTMRMNSALLGGQAKYRVNHLRRDQHSTEVDLEYRLTDKLIIKETRRLSLPLPNMSVMRRK